jgi:sugar-phosphatase
MGVTKYFPLIVSAEDVSHGKPDPEVFVVAASKIEIEPKLCIVFEDAQVGIDAGLAGGMKVIALSTTHPVEDLHGADRTVSRLDVLSVEDLLALVGSSKVK